MVDRPHRARAAAQDRGGGRLRRGARPLSEPFRVVFVCTGNRFRSPLAAAVFAEETEDLAVEVASLGTLDLGPEPALPEAVAVAEEFGLDLSSHRARQLADLRAFDVVVGFERKHVMAAVVDGGAAVERTFTLPELVDLLHDRVGSPRDRIAAAHASRPGDFRNRPAPEIRDPLGLKAPEQRAVAQAVEEQASELAALLFD